MNKSVFIIDDDEAARSSLTFMLRAERIRARSFPSALEFFDNLQPDHRGCIVTDVRMPGMSGIALVTETRNRGCLMPVIVITGHADVSLAVQAMKAGASDFIEKPFESLVMLRAIRKGLEAGEVLGEKQSRRDLVAQRLETLTDREREVFHWLALGKSSKEIGLTLGISPRTVDIHRGNVMAKMQAENIAELIRSSLILPDEA